MAFAFTIPLVEFGYWGVHEGEEGDAFVWFIVAGIGFVLIITNTYFSSRRIKYTITLDPVKRAIIYPNGIQVPFFETEEP